MTKKNHNAIIFLRKNSYSKVLVQEYLNYDCEYTIDGFSYNNNVSMPMCIRKLRIWPEKKGSMTLGIVESTGNIEKMKESLENLLREVKFNEVNWRNGGLSYAFGDYSICYDWYLSSVGKKYIPPNELKKSYYCMDDQGDLHNVIERKITYRQYLKDKKKSKIKLVENKDDPKPSRYMFIYKCLRNIFR